MSAIARPGRPMVLVIEPRTDAVEQLAAILDLCSAAHGRTNTKGLLRHGGPVSGAVDGSDASGDRQRYCLCHEFLVRDLGPYSEGFGFAARVLGGISAGMAYPTTLALIAALWSGPGRTRATALPLLVALAHIGLESGTMRAPPRRPARRRSRRHLKGIRRVSPPPLSSVNSPDDPPGGKLLPRASGHAGQQKVELSRRQCGPRRRRGDRHPHLRWASMLQVVWGYVS
jgi:hypothetical protein